MTCSIAGCGNEAVRVLVHKKNSDARLYLCMLHTQRAILYMTPEQVGAIVFPQETEPSGGLR